MKSIKYICLIFTLFFSLISTQAQEDREDDLGDVSDAFQHHYFEALKQKGIENYDKAIILLIECKNLAPENAAVHFELGKNYYELDKYNLAEVSLKKALELKPNNKWILESLYKLYRAKKDNSKVIATLKQLAAIKLSYNEELVFFYFKTQKYQEALALIDKLDHKLGIDSKREKLRTQIYLYSNKYTDQVTYIQKKINNGLATETDYTNLIYAYSRLEKPSKGYETAKLYKKAFPNSDVPYLSLYKYHLNQKNTKEAVKDMHRVAKSASLNDEEKYKVLNDFLNFSKDNPIHLPELEKATKAFPNLTILSKLALLYKEFDNKEKSTAYLDSVSKTESDDFEDLKLRGDLLLKANKTKEALKNSARALELYPAQPVFYLQQAKAYNLNKEPQKALESLNFGFDYLINDNKTEADFYLEMAKAYQQLNDSKNHQKYLQKAKKLNKQL